MKIQIQKDDFLETELGANMIECVRAWDKCITEMYRNECDTDEYREAEKDAIWRKAQMEVYRMVLRQIYGIEYYFSRSDTFFGILSADGLNWLYYEKKDRVFDEKGET